MVVEEIQEFRFAWTATRVAKLVQFAILLFLSLGGGAAFCLVREVRIPALGIVFFLFAVFFFLRCVMIVRATRLPYVRVCASEVVIFPVAFGKLQAYSYDDIKAVHQVNKYRLELILKSGQRVAIRLRFLEPADCSSLLELLRRMVAESSRWPYATEEADFG
jgi:hypothetical protein